VKKKIANVEKYVQYATTLGVVNQGTRRYFRSSSGNGARRSHSTKATVATTDTANSASTLGAA
jgi:hypothetical protein